eukprot:TRINITY_DN701_c0_g1_i7.p1 TRINITY_DN701_c0_g1~~TRINITY_DN701_c0_g1_i7.p1  ORF type:complete len:271 (-),score=16.17 TRINITY_DN701_c0_g1_i7:473-1285(-)
MATDSDDQARKLSEKPSLKQSLNVGKAPDNQETRDGIANQPRLPGVEVAQKFPRLSSGASRVSSDEDFDLPVRRYDRSGRQPGDWSSVAAVGAAYGLDFPVDPSPGPIHHTLLAENLPELAQDKELQDRPLLPTMGSPSVKIAGCDQVGHASPAVQSPISPAPRSIPGGGWTRPGFESPTVRRKAVEVPKRVDSPYPDLGLIQSSMASAGFPPRHSLSLDSLGGRTSRSTSGRRVSEEWADARSVQPLSSSDAALAQTKVAGAGHRSSAF